MKRAPLFARRLFALAALACPAVLFAAEPAFLTHTVATHLTGGYQVVVADLNHDGKPDLVALASGLPDLVWFENPAWTRHVIASGFNQMINCVVLDLDGRPAIVLAADFSNDARHSRGTLWLLQSQADVTAPWTKRLIDELPTSHRLRLADIDGSGRPVVVNAPLTGPRATPPDYRDHVPLVYYRPGQWRRTLLADQNQGVQHGIFINDWAGDHRDQILTASFSGIDRYRMQLDGRWSRAALAAGSPAPWPNCGASDIAVGRLGEHRFLCSIEPWHGHQVAVYRFATNGRWERNVIDNSFHDGHALAVADLNGDARDEVIAGYRGAGGGLVFYQAAAEGSRWNRFELDAGDMTAASCAVADLNGDGKPDIVAIGSGSANLKWYENRQ